jgi:hypothetical protein
MTVDAADKSAVVLRLTPQSGVGQEVKQSHLSIEPQVNLYEFHDAFGNLLQRIMLGQGRSIITSTCTVDTPDEIASDWVCGSYRTWLRFSTRRFDSFRRPSSILVLTVPNGMLVSLEISRWLFCSKKAIRITSRCCAGKAAKCWRKRKPSSLLKTRRSTVCNLSNNCPNAGTKFHSVSLPDDRCSVVLVYQWPAFSRGCRASSRVFPWWLSNGRRVPIPGRIRPARSRLLPIRHARPA